jgi:hypothetical protein
MMQSHEGSIPDLGDNDGRFRLVADKRRQGPRRMVVIMIRMVIKIKQCKHYDIILQDMFGG